VGCRSFVYYHEAAPSSSFACFTSSWHYLLRLRIQIVIDTLRTYARNFSLLRKSKEEMGIDMTLRTTEFDDDIEKVDNIAALCDDDNDWTDSAVALHRY
jgi:hypothetical protein